MSKTSGSSHFWPAYVDLMTVLLMVFMLLTLLFQMVASVARMNEGMQLNAAGVMDVAMPVDSGGLRLTFGNTDSPLLDAQKDEVRAWLENNLARITASGLSISARIPQAGDDVGRRLSSQFARILELKQLAVELNIDAASLRIFNQISGDISTAGEIQLSVVSE